MKKIATMLVIFAVLFCQTAGAIQRPEKKNAEAKTDTSTTTRVVQQKISSSSFSDSHYEKGDFNIGLTPGLAVGQSDPDVGADFGLVGNYFFRDNASIGLRFDTFTSFKRTALVFMPKIGFYHNINDNWTAYLNAGFGLAVLVSASKVYADMGIPGIGVSYHINDHFTASLDSNINVVIAKDSSAIVWSIGPMVSYKF